jgi:hypothetical protein
VICTEPGTDGANPTVRLIPKSHRIPEDKVYTKFYKDGPTKDRFPFAYNLQHLGPELSEKTKRTTTVMMTEDEQGTNLGVTGDRALIMAQIVQKQGLVEYVKGCTMLPTDVDEMTAFHNFVMRMSN